MGHIVVIVSEVSLLNPTCVEIQLVFVRCSDTPQPSKNSFVSWLLGFTKLSHTHSILSAKKNVFASSFPIWVPFFLFLAWLPGWASSATLDSSGENMCPALFLVLGPGPPPSSTVLRLSFHVSFVRSSTFPPLPRVLAVFNFMM